MTASAPRSAVSSSLVRLTVLTLAFGSAVACTAILKPRDDVQRCGNATECDPTGDNRYVPACRYDDAHQDLDSTKVSKICVADFKPDIGCNPMNYASGEGLKNGYYDLTEKDSCAVLSCTDENRGKVGCPPPSGGSCDDGLELVSFGSSSYCIDPDADQPVIPGASLAAAELDGQHIKDQFCKSYFCDDTFVCNNNTNKCTPCDPDRDYGDGGCGIVFNDGAPAPVYVLGDDLEGMCAGPDASTGDVVFGAC